MLERHRHVGPILAPAKRHNSTAVVVGWQNPPEVADQEVEYTITIEIDRLDVRRIRQPCDFHEGRLLFVRFGRIHDAVAHIAQHHLEPSVVVQIDESNVRHRLVGLTTRQRHDALPEPQRLIRFWPCGERGQVFGRVRFVIPNDRQPIRRQSHYTRRRSRRTARLRLVVLDQYILAISSRHLLLGSTTGAANL